MAAGHRNIVDSQVTLVSATQLEHCLRRRGSDDVDDTRRVFLLTERFEYHVVSLRFIILDQVVDPALCLHHERIGRFTDFALEGFPEVRREVHREFGLLAGLQPRCEAAVMDLGHCSFTFARSEERVGFVGLRVPAEAALALGVLVAHVLHSGGHFTELFEVLIVCITENAVCAVALLLLSRAIDVHLLVGVADFFDGEFHSADFEDITLLDFIVLRETVKSINLREEATYDFLVVDFQTTDNEVHGLLTLAKLLESFKVILMVHIGRTLQVEGFLVVVYNFQHGHVVRTLFRCVKLILERLAAIVMVQGELIARAHDHGFEASLESLFGQMTALVVEEAVTVATPRNTFHQHAERDKNKFSKGTVQTAKLFADLNSENLKSGTAYLAATQILTHECRSSRGWLTRLHSVRGGSQ